ncbi:hypothetical protein, partial [Sinomonas sp. G460-2]|uniref:hypothetical protein n=1 Tax=Sinomonas sp. G460-2 TaxID=3393464 RepID=UPI0039EF6E90
MDLEPLRETRIVGSCPIDLAAAVLEVLGAKPSRGDPCGEGFGEREGLVSERIGQRGTSGHTAQSAGKAAPRAEVIHRH